jgi:hypothetical protein
MKNTDLRFAIPTLAAFATNLAVAVFGTALLESPFERYAVVASGRQSFFNMDIMTSLFALGLGASIYQLLKTVTAKWIWVVGLFWYLQQLIIDPKHVLLWEIEATKSAFLDFQASANWSLYTLPCLWISFYSMGALICSQLILRKKRAANLLQLAPEDNAERSC